MTREDDGAVESVVVVVAAAGGPIMEGIRCRVCLLTTYTVESNGPLNPTPHSTPLHSNPP
jgi:hypothetical protein